MAFLDNSGDIILDAVLTDTGRFRLAKGDGSFKIAKFALGDDEINYGNFNKNHTSGSAYFDLNILQTPILEAFTNNASSMQSKLISISRTDLLFLPVMKINDSAVANKKHSSGLFLFTVDSATNTAIFGPNGQVEGIYKAFEYAGQSDKFIKIDQGLDTAAISFLQPLDADLVENQYIIEIDSRLGSIVDKTGANSAVASFIDDDYIASYYLSTNDTNFANVIPAPTTTTATSSNILAGPAGTRLEFKIKASSQLSTSTFLFTQMGSTTTVTPAGGGSVSVKYIDSIVSVMGATTGYRLDIPVRFIKS